MTNAGWYPDPAGAPDTYRYWDGQSWSQMTTSQPPGGGAQSTPPGGPPAGGQPPTQVPPSSPYGSQPQPGQPQQPQQPGQYGEVPNPAFPGQAGPGQGGYGGPGGPGQPPYGQPGWNQGPQGGGGGGGAKIALIAVAAVVVLTLIAVGAFFLFRGDGGDDDDSRADKSGDSSESVSEDASESGDSSASPSESSTIQPSGIQCTGGGGELDADPPKGATTLSGGGLTIPIPAGYTYDGRNASAFTFGKDMVAAWKLISENWVSEYAVGGLPLDNGFESTEDAAEIVMQCLTLSDQVYSGFESRKDLQREDITVGGKPGYRITAEIRVNDPQVTEEGDVTTVIIVDTGSDTEYGIYLGIVPIGDAAAMTQQETQIKAIKVG